MLAEKPDTELVVMQPNPQSGSSKLMALIEHLGHNPHMQIETLKELLAVKAEFEREEARKAFHSAMAEFSRNIPVILKNKHVYYEKKDGSIVDYWHESLDSVVDAITGELAAVGISKRWTIHQENGMITVGCVLTHAMGHTETPATMSAKPDESGNKNSVQAIKSTVTYLERTTLLAATGTAPKSMVKDDDGRAAGGGDEDPGTRMDERLVVERIEWIKAAERSSDILPLFHDAVKDAQGDKRAIRDFTNAMLGVCIPWISGAANAATLQGVYARAYDMADSVDDQGAKKQLVAAKDARKKQLQGAPR